MKTDKQEGKNENYSERIESSSQKLVEPATRSQKCRKILAKAIPSTIMNQLLVPRLLHGNKGNETQRKEWCGEGSVSKGSGSLNNMKGYWRTLGYKNISLVSR